MKEYFDEMKDFALFDKIGENFPSMLKCIGGFFKTFDKNNYIILDGDFVECVGVIITGKVHIIKEDIWGNKTILAIIKPSEIFGETYVFGGINKSSVSFFAAEKTEVLFLPFNRVIHTCSKSCEHHQKLIDNMVAMIARKNVQLTEKLEITAKRTLRAKILTFLSLESQKSNNRYFSVPFGRIEMADYLCVNRSALTRELTKMKDEGILDYNNNTFRLFE